MKKTIYFLMVILVAFAFVSCESDGGGGGSGGGGGVVAAGLLEKILK
ncbi:MAG: hypothetical protein FWE72_03545 [Spirochaetaceae bacterium]|nr:hypothetical protein [Spirochaetaceae bacterium]